MTKKGIFSLSEQSRGLYFEQEIDENGFPIKKENKKYYCKTKSSEKAYELYNYFGQLTQRYDLAADMALKVCDEWLWWMEEDDKETDTCGNLNTHWFIFWSNVKTELYGLRPQQLTEKEVQEYAKKSKLKKK